MANWEFIPPDWTQGGTIPTPLPDAGVAPSQEYTEKKQMQTFVTVSLVAIAAWFGMKAFKKRR